MFLGEHSWAVGQVSINSRFSFPCHKGALTDAAMWIERTRAANFLGHEYNIQSSREALGCLK